MEVASAPRSHAAGIRRPRRVLALLSDERLVDHVRRGDAVAFEVLYDRHVSGILGFCRHMLGSSADAEDAVQHAFSAAYSDLRRNAEREIHLKAWLYTIARNRCLSVLRARREQAADDIEIVTDRFSDDVQERAELAALLDDVHQLPQDQREALVLSELGGLSHAEVAQVVGCEDSKVKSLVFQARSALIDRRTARETPCDEIREQIANLRGGALRRSHLRHHLAACPGCTEYREQIRRQRQMLAIALPVLPSAGLRGQVLGALGIGGGGTTIAAGGGGTGIALAAKAGVTKLAVVAAVAGGTVGGATIVNGGQLPLVSHGDSAGAAGSSASDAANKPVSEPGGQSQTGGPESRSESGSEHGFTPETGGSNGERAREFAKTRGKGRHRGLGKAHRKARGGRGKAAPRSRSRAGGRAAEKRASNAPRTRTAPTTRTQDQTAVAPKTESAPRTQTAPTTESAPAPKSQSAPPQKPEPEPTAPAAEPVESPAPAPGGPAGTLERATGKTK